MIARIVAIGCALLVATPVAALPAAAQTSPTSAPAAAQPVDADRLSAARELAGALQMDKQYDTMFAQLIPVMTVQIFDSVKNNVEVPVAIRQKLADGATMADAQRFFALDVSKQFKRRYPGMIDATAREYAAAFTADELRQLTAFYRTPIGQKALAVLPELQRKIMPIGMEAGKQAGMAAMKATIDHLGLEKPATAS